MKSKPRMSHELAKKFSIFEHVLSRLSNVMNMENYTLRKKRPSYCCMGTHISPRHHMGFR